MNIEHRTSNSPQASKHLSAFGGSNVEWEKMKEEMNVEHPPAMQSTQGQNNNCSTNINVISVTENLHKGIAGRSNVQLATGEQALVRLRRIEF